MQKNTFKSAKNIRPMRYARPKHLKRFKRKFRPINGIQQSGLIDHLLHLGALLISLGLVYSLSLLIALVKR